MEASREASGSDSAPPFPPLEQPESSGTRAGGGEGEDAEETDILMSKAQKIMDMINSSQVNPNPNVLHALASLIETQELRQREGDYVIKKPEGSRNARYVDTRLDEVYPSIKPTSRLSLLSVKSNYKENQVNEDKGAIKSSLPSHLTLKSHREQNGKHASVTNANNSVSQHCKTSGKDSQHRFRCVAELSLGSDRFSQMGTLDMDKVMKGLAARETSASCPLPNVSGKFGDVKSASSGNFCSEVLVAVRKVPLDLTLKTALRMVSSHPVNRFHRLLMGDTYNGMASFSLQFGYSGNQSISLTSNSPTSTDSCSLNSWIYPQSLLPPSVMSVLSSSIAGGETDFLNKRKLAWEDSFRSLYYMLRKSRCDLFYGPWCRRNLMMK